MEKGVGRRVLRLKIPMETATFQALARMHPLHLPQLVAQIVQALACDTGIPGSDTNAYAPLMSIKERNALKVLDWGNLTALLQEKATCDKIMLAASIEAAQLLLNRSELHAWLYLDAKHSSTLKLQGKYNFPVQPLPLECSEEHDYFVHLLEESDNALDAGLAGLKQFQHMVIHDPKYVTLRRVLDRAYTSYMAYDEARTHANRVFETILHALASPQPAKKRVAWLVA
jgi:hypothetical protein